MSIADSVARVEGHGLNLRLVQEEDAEYIFGLRTNSAYSAHLSQVTGTAADQQVWIRSYKAREAEGREFYYVVERKCGQSCGLVRLYDISGKSFCWGSWILDHNKPPKAALESAVLSFRVAFDLLDLLEATVEVRVENAHAERFYRRFGMVETGRDAENIHFAYSAERYRTDLDGYLRLLTGEVEA